MIAVTRADPSRYTVGELSRMAEALDSAEWRRLSVLLATMINLQTTKKVKPWQLNPYHSTPQKPLTIRDLTTMLRGSDKTRKVKRYAP